MDDRLKKTLAGVAALAALGLGGAALAGATGGGGSQPAAEQAESEEPNEANERENSPSDPDDVQEENEADEADEQVTGADARGAERAAVEAAGGGKAESVERDSEKGATYEVEVTKRDGSSVDVRLDDRFEVVAVDADDESERGEDEEREEPAR